jgi:hypothetical protein
MIQFYSNRDPRSEYSWPYVYAHGMAEGVVDEEYNQKIADEEEWGAPDLIASSNVSQDSVETGVYNVRLYDEDAILYFWWYKSGFYDSVREDVADHVEAWNIPSGPDSDYSIDEVRKYIPIDEWPEWEDRGWRIGNYVKAHLRPHGLVALPDDAEANEYARVKLEEEASIL